VTEATVERLHIACTAHESRRDDALALRQRLVTTGRTHLPQALAHALRDDGELRVLVERIRVDLDFDASEYDDVTLAALWAGRVARALGELDGSRPGVHVFRSTPAFLSGAVGEVLEHGRLSWVYAELGCGEGALRPAEFLARIRPAKLVRSLVAALAADERLALRLYDGLASDERRSVTASLRGEERWGAWTAAASRTAGAAARPQAGHDQGRSAGVDTPASSSLRRGGPPGRPEVAARPSRRSRAEEPSLAAWLGAIRTAAAEDARRIRFGAPPEAAPPLSSTSPAAPRTISDAPATTPADAAAADAPASPARTGDRQAAGRGPSEGTDDSTSTAAEHFQRVAWWSHAGGLVLLYPWLHDYLSGELPVPEPLHGVDPVVAARLWALAALGSDDPEPLVGDPLARLLAGAEPTDEATPPLRAEPCPALDAARARVLSDFAALLPGLEGSSAEYVRRWFILREALVEPVEEGVLLVRLAGGPLDVLLERLPYPLGAFRLPWTPIVLVERRGSDA
jgi:hypothetical protein